jgi:hypothetical protein
MHAVEVSSHPVSLIKYSVLLGELINAASTLSSPHSLKQTFIFENNSLHKNVDQLFVMEQ